MPEMQAEDLEGDGNAGTSPENTADWLLEDSYRVVQGPERDQITVFANGVATAVLEGHFNTKEFEHTDPEFKARVYDFTRLDWTQVGALFRLQGQHALDVLGPTVCILRGKHRPVWDPRPGMDDVRVLLPLHNPKGLRPLEVFQLAMREGL